MEDVISLGSWIRQRRKSLDLTQEALARLVGCATVTLQKIELEERRPSEAMAGRLAEVLHLPAGERAAFVQIARGHRAADWLASPPPAQGALPDARRALSNLSVPRTRLIGREREVAQLRALLLRGDVGLVTLTGPGGTGKTRLSTHVAAGLLDHFPDGVFVVELALITDPGLLLLTIASTLQVGERGGQPLIETLKDYLRPKHLLLLLDNFEQIVAAASVVGELLRAALHLKVVTTSRMGLRIAGEYEYPVPPLDVPNLSRLPPLDQVTQYAAVTLFVERVTAVKPGFAVTTVTAPTVAEICVRLDGLPLAIELAAARVKILPPEALLQRLQSRLSVLTGGARDLPVRQQTLRNTIDWSYSLLAPDEQRLFTRLAVFMSGCTLEAVEAVCLAEDERAVDVLDGLQSLVETCLLRQEEGPGGAPRFVMLETIHEYAREHLEASGEAKATRQRHAAYYLAVVERAEPELEGANQIAWLQRLAAEHDNLRAALAWSCVAPDTIDVSLLLTAALYGFWFRRRHLSEARAWLKQALARPGGSPTARAKALFCLGQIADHLDEHAWAMSLFGESLALFYELGDRTGIARVLLNQGRILRQQGAYDRARSLGEKSLLHFQELGDRAGVSMALLSLGDVALDQGDLEGARTHFDHGRRLSQELGLMARTATATLSLSHAAHHEGNAGEASRLLAESLALFRSVGDQTYAGGLLLGIARSMYRQDDGRATLLFRESLTLLGAMGTEADVSECLAGLAGVSAAEGEAQRAARLLGAAQARRAAGGSPLSPFVQAEHARGAATARAQLGEEAWAAAWAEGQGMTLEQAIAYALEPPAKFS